MQTRCRWQTANQSRRDAGPFLAWTIVAHAKLPAYRGVVRPNQAIMDNHIDRQTLTRPAHLEDWLDALPYADFLRTTEILKDAVTTTNQESIKPATRMELNHLYWRPYIYLLNSQVKVQAPSSLQSVDTKQQWIEALKQLALEIAAGCKLAIVDALAKKTRFIQSKPPIDEMFLATKLLAHVLVLNFHEYSPTPNNVWRDLHDLYLQAESMGVTTLEANNPELDPPGKSTIHLAYLQVLATSLSDPHHLSHGIVWEIYDQLYDWALDTRLSSFRKVKNPAGFFALDVKKSDGPVPYAKFDSNTPIGQARLFDCTALQRYVQQQLDHLNKAGSVHSSLKISASSARSVLGHLNKVWGLPPKRYFPREDHSGNVNIACGLNVAYHFCNDSREFDVHLPASGDDEVTDSSYDDGLATAISTRYQLENWQMVNKGPGGYAVYTNKKPRNVVRVGELIALNDDQDTVQQWIAGAVRWLMIQRDGAHKIGIQTLNKTVRSGGVRALKGSEHETQFRRALLLSDTTDANFALVAPRGLHAVDRPIEVFVDGKRLQARITDLIESTVAFEHFNCAI